MSRHLLRRCAFLLFLPLAMVRTVAQPMVLDPAFAPSVEQGGSAVESARFVPAPDGRIFAFGFGYTTSAYVNEVPVPHGIARLQPDGSLDPNFTARLAPDEIVQDAVVLADGRVLVSIKLTSGSRQGRVVRLLTSGQIDATFALVGIGGLASAKLTKLSDGSVIVWGGFDSVGGYTRNGLARVLADGAVDATYGVALTTGLLDVVSLVATPDDRVVLSAATYQRDSASVGGPIPAQGYHFVRLTRAGAIDPTFTPAPPSITYPVLVGLPDNRLFVGGHELRLLKADGSVDATFTSQIPQLRYVRHGALLPGNRLAVEVDTEISTLPDRPWVKSVFILKPDGAIERDCRGLPGAERIQYLRGAFPDGRLLLIQGPLTWVLAPFTELSIYYVPGMAEPKLCLVDPTAGTLNPWPTMIEVTGSSRVTRLTLDPAGRVLAEGNFTRIAGVSRRGFARFNLDGTLDTTFAPGAVTPLYHLPDGRVIASQTTLDPVDADGFRSNGTRIVRLNSDGTVDPAFTPPADLDFNRVAWLATAPDGRILISATEIGTGSARVPKLIWLGPNGARQTTLSTVFPSYSADSVVGIGAHAGIAAAILADGKLLVRPTTATINGAPSALLVRLNADGSTDSSYRANTSPLGDVTDPKPLPDGRAYIMGTRVQIGAIQPFSVLRLNPDGSPDTFVEPALAYGIRLSDASYLYGNSRYHPDGTRDMNYESPVREFYNLNSAVLTRDGNIWMAGSFGRTPFVPDRTGLGRMIPAEVAGFSVQPQQRARTVVGLDAMLQAELGTAAPATFQWTFNGTPIPGATSRTLRLAHAKLSDAGDYRLVATVGGTNYTSNPSTLTVDPNTTRLVNFSARSVVSPTHPPQIGGLVLRSPLPRGVLLRGIGRGLPVDNPGFTLLPRPTVTLFRGATVFAQDSGGALAPAIADAAQRLGAFPPRPMFTDNQPTRDSALLLQLFPGAYTVHASSADGQPGVNLFEFYDADRASETSAAVNVSVRGRTALGSDVLIAGFVVGGRGAMRLLIRGIGPGIAALGVAGAVGDPQISLHNESNIPGTNDNWNDQVDVGELIDATQRTGAFPLAAGSRDAALLVTVVPGAYTVHGSSVDGTPGEMMIELYVVED